MVKRLLAVTAGATMLGATAMGAMAADLSNYPNDFVTDGVFNGYLVVGENAAPVDNLALTDIAARMKYMAAGTSSTTTLEGDNWPVGTSSKKFEVSNSNATDSSIGEETIRSIATFISEDELAALADAEWETNAQNFGYQQYLYFDDTDLNTEVVKFTENNDNDVTDVHFYVGSGDQIARYKIEFTTTAQSDVTDSTGTADTSGAYLDDFENTDITFLGQTFTVVKARRPTVNVDSVELTLMAGSARDTLLELDSGTYTVGDVEYEVTLTYVDSTYAKFTVNGQQSNKLAVGETFVLSDGNEIGVSEVLYQGYAGGVHSATFYVGAQKLVLKDDNIATGGGSYNVKSGSEDIDGTTVIITGTDNNVTSRISTIEVNMTAEDDFWVPAGSKLSEVIAAVGEEKEVLFTNNWDIDFQGLSTEDTHDMRLKTSSTKRYNLNLFDGDGNAVDLPIAYSEGSNNLSIGEESWTNGLGSRKELHLNESMLTTADGADIIARNRIYKDDYFVLTSGTTTDGSAKSYLMQYKGGDRSGKTSPKIKFKNIGNGETLEYSASNPGTANGTVATIKVGGNSFIVTNASTMATDDFQLYAALNGDSDYIDGALVSFVDSYGAVWTLTGMDNPSGNASYIGDNGTAAGPDSWIWTMSTPNTDDYDNVPPANVVLTITSDTASQETRADLTGYTLLTPEGVTEVKYGYSSMGTKIQFNEPSGDPDEMTLTYPVDQKLPQLYVTSGATTTSTSGDGTLTPVSVTVDATKLDVEVADVTAQNLIVVGGPCINSVAAELLGSSMDYPACTQGFKPGTARVKVFDNGENVAMLVAGYTGAETRVAGKVVAERYDELSGEEVEIEGTTWSDATISAPTVVEEVEATEETTE